MDLATALAGAVSRKSHPAERQQLVAEHESTNHLLNSWHNAGGGYYYGSLFEYRDGALPAIFRLDAAATELRVETINALESGTQVLQSALLFGVMANHVVLVPSTAIRAGDFERYANWLMHETSVLSETERFALTDEPERELRTRDWRKVKGITIHSRIVPPAGGVPSENGATSRTRDVMDAIDGVFGISRLTDAGMNAARAQSLAQLGVTIQLKYDGRRPLDTSLLDHVASLLQSDTETRYELDISGIGTVSDGQIRVAKKGSIAYNGEQPVLADAGAKMKAWLDELLRTERIRSL